MGAGEDQGHKEGQTILSLQDGNLAGRRQNAKCPPREPQEDISVNTARVRAIEV